MQVKDVSGQQDPRGYSSTRVLGAAALRRSYCEYFRAAPTIAARNALKAQILSIKQARAHFFAHH